jgi:hypothetical protein
MENAIDSTGTPNTHGYHIYHVLPESGPSDAVPNHAPSCPVDPAKALSAAVYSCLTLGSHRSNVLSNNTRAAVPERHAVTCSQNDLNAGQFVMRVM